MTQSATRGTVNSTLRVELAGFPADAYVELAFAGATVATMTTGGDGTATTWFVVPAKPQGVYQIRAVGGAADVVATYAIAPRIKVMPGAAGPGDQVAVSLRGFGRNEQIRIRWLVDGRYVQVGLVARTSNTGSANLIVTVPAGAPPGLTSVRGDGTLARAQTNAVFVTE